MQFNGTISDLVQTTRDLELQGHATLQVTFAISGTIHVRAMTFFCFYGFSGRAIQWHYQWPCTNNAWPWTSRSRDFTRWPLLSRALYMLERWLYFVSTVSRVVQFNGTISDLVQTTRDLELQGHATLQVTFAISGTIHVRAMTFFCFYGFSGRAIQWHYQYHVLQYLVQIYLVPWYHGTNVPIGYRPNMGLKSKGNKQIANVGW